MTPQTDAPAYQGERFICYCRLVFCALVLIRFFAMAPAIPFVAFAFYVTTIALAMAFSVVMLRKIRAGTATPAGLMASIAVDAAGCFLCLLCKSVWPGMTPYPGILARPDPTAMFVMVYSAGFRLSPAMAVLGGSLNALGFVVLMVVEHHLYPTGKRYGWPEVFFFALTLISVCSLSIATAFRSRKLVRAAMTAATKVERARQDLTHLVRDQHDARSLLSAVNLNADLVCTTLNQSGRADEPALLQLADALKRDLTVVNGYVRSLGELAFGQLVGLRDTEPVDVPAVVAAAVAGLRLRYPGVTIACDVAGAPAAMLAGGSSALERLLLNLVSNAVEGDGLKGARRVGIVAGRDGRQMVLAVADDGPGFAHGMLQDVSTACRTTKPRGSGLGLFGMVRLVESCGGLVSLANREGGGACVEIRLPVAAAVEGGKNSCPAQPVRRSPGWLRR